MGCLERIQGFEVDMPRRCLVLFGLSLFSGVLRFHRTQNTQML